MLPVNRLGQRNRNPTDDGGELNPAAAQMLARMVS